MSWLLIRKICPVAIAAAIAVTGCGKGVDRRGEGDVAVVSLGDTSLMMMDVIRRIPRGLSPEDSVNMFRSIVETWLQRHVLTEFAERNLPDMADIDRMVDQYRSDLILGRYLAMMDRQGKPNVSDRRVDRYLDQRRDSMVLEEPVVKGIFLKVSADDRNLETLRNWMCTPGPHSFDKLEEKGLRGATQYEYFQDRWHPWHEVADLVPYQFFDADAFLEDNSDFETEYGGSVYMIHISEYVGTGREMPREYAREQVREALRQGDIMARRRSMISDIYKHEMKEGRLRKGLYDPSTGTLADIKR